MANAKFLQEGENIFFPIGHTDAIFNSEGTNLTGLLSDLNKKDIKTITFNNSTRKLKIEFNDSTARADIEIDIPDRTYTAGAGLNLNGTEFTVKTGYSSNGKNYAIQSDSNGLYVNVPWTNTTYTAGTGLTLDGTTFKYQGAVLTLENDTSYEAID